MGWVLVDNSLCVSISKHSSSIWRGVLDATRLAGQQKVPFLLLTISEDEHLDLGELRRGRRLVEVGANKRGGVVFLVSLPLLAVEDGKVEEGERSGREGRWKGREEEAVALPATCERIWRHQMHAGRSDVVVRPQNGSCARRSARVDLYRLDWILTDRGQSDETKWSMSWIKTPKIT